MANRRLDLSNVKAVLNGSEPISAATVRRFNEAFGPFGFNPKAHQAVLRSGRGHALRVDHRRRNEPPKIVYVDRDELNAHRFVEVPEDAPSAVAQASAGKVGVAEWATIVDAEIATELPDGQIGEIWISGQNMGTGYWNKPEETVATFQNILKSRTNPSHAEGATDDATWVSTGDYGAFHDGDLYITGRVKDLVIIDGRNHYPQDLEYSAQEASKALRTGFVAAFSVPANQLPDEVFDNAHAGLKRDPQDTSEQLVIVAERARRCQQDGPGAGGRRDPRRDRGPPRRHRARRAPDARRRDPTNLERKDRSPGLPRRPTSTAACATERSPTTSPTRRTDAVSDRTVDHGPHVRRTEDSEHD